ncbi:Glucan 1,3-beta-glucosidase 1 [Candida tropicalis]
MNLVHLVILFLPQMAICRVNDKDEFLSATFILQGYFNNSYQSMSSVYEDELQKIYGVSLGGWLVTEPWITPTLYENVQNIYVRPMPVDEYTLTATLGKDIALEYLQPHWEDFYSEDDFEEIANLGLNLVRIPIGYWAFGLLEDDPFVQGQEEYLDKAIVWATNHNLKVQVGIHGMPGSQNGFDNSGHSTATPSWLEVPENMELTYEVVNYVLDKYGNHSTVHSIQLVNEPMGLILNKEKLMNFYTYCLDQVVEKNIQAKLVFHDAFLNIEAWKNFPGEYILDHHLYEIFSEWQITLSVEQHLDTIRRQGESIERSGQRSIVGEFSGALTDCTKYINGVGKGSRWEGTFESRQNGSCLGRDDPNHNWFKEDVMKFLQEQFYVYEEKGSGWIFWCWKTESTLDWDMQRLNMLEMLPDPLFRFAHMNNEQNFTSSNINIDNNSSREDSQFNVTEAKITKTRTKNETIITDTELSVFEYFLITLLLFFRFW